MELRINQAKAGAVLSYSTQFVQILTGVIYTPVMLRLLGQSEYGLYQLVYSVVSYLSLLSLGFGAGYFRFYSRYKTKDDSDSIAKLNGMFLLIFSFLSLVCLICGVFLVSNARQVLGDNLTSHELNIAKTLLGLMVFNVIITFINAVFASIIAAHERFFFQKLNAFLRALMNPLLSLMFLVMGFGSVGMVLATAILCVASLFIEIIYCFKKLDTRFCFSNLNFSLLREMWTFTFFIFINMIIDQLNWTIGKVLLGRMIGTAAVAVYGVANQIRTLYISLPQSINNVFVPRINLMVAKGERSEKLNSLFNRVGRIQFIIVGMVLIGFILFGKEFVLIWAGKEYAEAYQIALMLIIPATISMIQGLGVEVQRAKNLHKISSLAYFVVAVLNVVVSIPLIKSYGVRGAAVGTLLSLLVGTGIFMNIYYHKVVKLDIISFWKEIFKLLVPMIFSYCGALIIKHFIPASSVVGLGLNIIIYCCLYLAFMWLSGMDESEKNLIKVPLRKIMRRR